MHEGQGVLVTEYIKGSKPKIDTATQRRLGDLLGRLHSMKGAPKPVRRPAGAQHLYTVDHAVRSEIDTARAALEAGAFRGTDKAWERLPNALASADDFSSLPTAPIHPDPGSVNAIASNGQVRLIDWSGAGSGPRVLGLGLLLSAPTSGKAFKREWVDAIMNAHSAHVSLKAEDCSVSKPRSSIACSSTRSTARSRGWRCSASPRAPSTGLGTTKASPRWPTT